MKRLCLLLVTLFTLFIVVPAPAFAATDVLKDACGTSGAAGSSACGNNGSDPIAGANGILAKTTRIISYLAGVAAVLLIIISGFMFATANGDSGKVSNARTTMIYAVIGVGIVIVAQSIIVFVLGNV